VAREAGVTGAIVYHARGSGVRKRLGLLGIAVEAERDMVTMLAATDHRDLLRSKLRTLERSGWSFEAQQGMPPDPDALSAELQATESVLASLGADSGALQANLDIVTDIPGHAEQQLWGKELVMYLDRMNIQRDAQAASAQQIELHELHNGRGQYLVALLVSLAPAELPPREDFSVAAARYLN